jgi:hypothetical protein
VATSEALGFPAGLTALHVNDLAVSDRQHLEPLDRPSVSPRQRCRADDLVADERELGLDLGRRSSALLSLKGENLTGLVGAASRRRLLPPEVTVRDAAPLGVLSEEGCERFWIALVQCVGCGAQLVDHALEYRTDGSVTQGVGSYPGRA